MQYHRLSRRVNNMAGFSLFMDVTVGGFLNNPSWMLNQMLFLVFFLLPCCLCNIRIQTGRNRSARVWLGLKPRRLSPGRLGCFRGFFREIKSENGGGDEKRLRCQVWRRAYSSVSSVVNRTPMLLSKDRELRKCGGKHKRRDFKTKEEKKWKNWFCLW